MRFNVPQFIDIEDKIMGPLSLKQFLLLLAGAITLIILWSFLSLWMLLVVGIPLVGYLLASVFIKINGRPFNIFLISWINYWFNPRVYIWRKK